MTTPNWTGAGDIPSAAANFDSLAALAGKNKADFEAELVGKISEIASPFNLVLGGVDAIFANSDFAEETKQLLRDLFDALTGNFFDQFPWFQDLQHLLTNVGSMAWDFIKTLPFVGNLIDWLGDITQANWTHLNLSWFTNLQSLLSNGLVGLVNTLHTLVNNGLGGLIQAFNDLMNNPFVQSLIDLLEDPTGHIGDVVNGLLAFIKKVTELLGGGNTAQEVLQWLQETLDNLWGNLLGEVGQIGKTFSDVVTGFLKNVLTIFSGLNADKLFGQIGEWLLGVIPVSNIANQTVNLMTSPTFDVTDAVSPTDGWSWDSTISASGGGGSVKVVCNGNDKRLFNRTPIRVAAGNQLNMSGKVMSTGLTGTAAQAVLAVLEYKGTALAGITNVAVKTGISTVWSSFSGDYTVPAGVTSLVVRLSVENATSGTVWFDDLDVHKTGLMAQDLVSDLNTTWENVYQGVTGTSGAGKRWYDMAPALGGVSSTANTASTNAGTSLTYHGLSWNSLFDAFNGTSGSYGKNYLDVGTKASGVRSTANTADTNAGTSLSYHGLTWNSLWDAFNGTTGSTGKTYDDAALKAAGVRSNASTALTNANTATGGVTNINQALFNSNTTGTKIKQEALPLSTILPTAGSGALLTRKTTDNMNAAQGRFPFNPGFYTHLDVASPDIQALTTSGGVGTGQRSDYSGIFRVTYAGWYLAEISVRLNASFSYDWRLAPVLFRNGSIYKIGSDAIVGARYSQSSFIVYLPENGTVQAGFDGAGYALDLFDADLTGAETYFSLSLLNRSYA